MQDSYPLAPPPPPLPPANPYAAPVADPYVPLPGSPAEAERIRHELLKHETTVKSIGSLYLLGAALFVLTSVAMGFTVFFSGSAPGGGAGDAPAAAAWGMLAFCLAIAALYFWIGRGLRRLDGSVRIVAIALSVFGLLGFPLGTLISAYFLYLLAGEKGKRVLSPEYQAIVAATPHIRYRSPWLIVALALVALFVVVIGLIVAFAGR